MEKHSKWKITAVLVKVCHLLVHMVPLLLLLLLLLPGPGYPPQQGFPPQYGGPAYGHQPYPMAQQYPAQPDTVTVQPMVFVSAGPLANPVNDYLCYSIFTLLCCFWPLGVAALVYSISTRTANQAGDQVMAERNSRTARTLNHVAVGLGIAFLILTVRYIHVLL
ncbi:dispanin subfamily A member 2b-like isoform X2 [Stegastes partitus]|uniref:Dispanin subfamily A member 2b-like isoform X2 n=1 Tax=Stegastes partitus TaxID=144197 RepID=A0A9Y4N355_9TELE|nr:PREDICTED: dispanin subfamily A member 2b-like isoform X2 [Stegastes partitus]